MGIGWEELGGGGGGFGGGATLQTCCSSLEPQQNPRAGECSPFTWPIHGPCCDVAARRAWTLAFPSYRTPPPVPAPALPAQQYLAQKQTQPSIFFEMEFVHAPSWDLDGSEQRNPARRHAARGGEARCTYPGPSVVMMGFRPSFFRFLFSVELPFCADAPVPAAGFCPAEASFACCEPFILRIQRSARCE
jgi:hypothetical protein